MALLQDSIKRSNASPFDLTSREFICVPVGNTAKVEFWNLRPSLSKAKVGSISFPSTSQTASAFSGGVAQKEGCAYFPAHSIQSFHACCLSHQGAYAGPRIEAPLGSPESPFQTKTKNLDAGITFSRYPLSALIDIYVALSQFAQEDKRGPVPCLYILVSI